MTDEFLTQGLQSDRYLKALRLIDQFEAEIEATLRTVGQQMIAEHPDLFESGIEGSEHTQRDRSAILAHTRINYPMARVPKPGSDDTLRLNVHLYWRNPAKCNRTDVDGALRAFGYKIKGLGQDDDDRVAAATREWPLETAENPWDSSTVFYSHVSSAEEIEQTAETLIEHFGRFGNGYGVAPGE